MLLQLLAGFAIQRLIIKPFQHYEELRELKNKRMQYAKVIAQRRREAQVRLSVASSLINVQQTAVSLMQQTAKTKIECRLGTNIAPKHERPLNSRACCGWIDHSPGSVRPARRRRRCDSIQR